MHFVITHEPRTLLTRTLRFRTLRSNFYLFKYFPRLLNIYNPAHCVSHIAVRIFSPPNLPQCAGFMSIWVSLKFGVTYYMCIVEIHMKYAF